MVIYIATYQYIVKKHEKYYFVFSDFNNTKPPGYCGFDQDTGADKFCCSDSDPSDTPIKEPQQPLFQKDSKAYPCSDQTSHCERWIETNGESCTPLYVGGFNQNSYPFMREVCQESCRKTAFNFRSNKCEKVTSYICQLKCIVG